MDPSDPLHLRVADDSGAPPDGGAPAAPATADSGQETRRTPARAVARPAGRADFTGPLAPLFATPGFAFGRAPPAIAAAPLDPGGAPDAAAQPGTAAAGGPVDPDLDSPPATQPPAPARPRVGRPRGSSGSTPGRGAARAVRGRPSAAADPAPRVDAGWGRPDAENDDWFLDEDDPAPPAAVGAPALTAALAALGAALRPAPAAPAPGLPPLAGPPGPAPPAAAPAAFPAAGPAAAHLAVVMAPAPPPAPPPVPLAAAPAPAPDIMALILAAITAAHPRPPAPAAAAAPVPAPAAPSVGLFRAAHEPLQAGIEQVRAPTLAELRGVPVAAVLLLFDDRRLAEITRPRDALEDARAAAAAKAQETLARQGYAHTAADTETHSVFFGFQVVLRTGLSPMLLGRLIGWAVPFAVNTPGDISLSPEWAPLYALAATLLQRLRAELAGCRVGDREYNLPTSVFMAIRTLGETYFRTRAQALYPLLSSLGPSPLEDHARTIIRGYIAQATDLPRAWTQIETLIQAGGFIETGRDAALSENAARTAIAMPLLTAMTQGQARNWTTTDMITAHLAVGAPGVAPAPAWPVAPPAPTPAPPAPPAARATLPAADINLGFRLSPSGTRVHPTYYSGEYAPPAGWLPPPSGAPPAGGAGPAPPSGRGRTTGTSDLCIPVARDIVTTSSPFASAPTWPCEVCKRTGHAQYECPRRFFTTYNRPLPGFLPSGEFDPAAWFQGAMLPATRAAMAAYLTELHIPPHRKFGVTTAHILAGAAPPPPGP